MDIGELRPPSASGPWSPPEFLPPLDGPGLVTGRSWSGCTYAALEGYRPLLLDVHLPPGTGQPWPAVMWIHGGGWATGDRRYVPLQWPQTALFQTLLDRGLAVVTVDYRHLREAPLPACLRDCRAALRYVRHFAADLEIDPRRIGVWGESAGGTLATLVALFGSRDDLPESLRDDSAVPTGDMSVRAAVDWYGPSDLVRLGRERPDLFTDPAAAELVSPLHQVHAGAPPTLLMHGLQDGMVPVEESRSLHAALVGRGVEATLRVVPDADHCFIGQDVRPLLGEAADFLAEALR
ncbi:alpha/beta hydrolase [Actinotalea sp. M2MS4P-6]|uniref:alpha/beta hydrolase n=1 Tax=Actinotalea sp. M2MS4P-6 TaxID=2983762 RepID=UPI0021E4F0CF|nr:alpha/beta hydrolase [Actinotalea sp. M2MS4P-6]MCV2392911.1 alpha/beta hydrolase [Actinotalea sp. M2MS4P-6]